MLDEAFFHSALGACVIQLSSLGEDVSFRKIRELWGASEFLSNSEREFLLLELTKLEAKAFESNYNILTFKKPFVK
ncbi:hypothetical protein [Rosenbergiella nectarea]|uniref:hypothetical protein n=1 Tax=Rosenbergiella nectarea TaxID=988801 RepID=UPI001F4E3EE5|nr:hypothetical protein [Rosenbergiella nectarea]